MSRLAIRRHRHPGLATVRRQPRAAYGCLAAGRDGDGGRRPDPADAGPQPLRRAIDKTVVLVLQDINFASCYTDRIIAMRDGRLAHYGTPQEIIGPEVLSALYELEIAVHEVGGHRICTYYR